MSIWSDIKKAAKGSKEYQKGKAKRKAKRAKSPLGKAAKQVAKDVKSAVKGSKEYQAGKAKRKAAKVEKKVGKAWTKAVKAQKKTGGKTMNELIKARNAAKASGDKSAYATAQNKINKAYGSKKVHKAETPKPKAKVDVTDRVKAVKAADKKMSSEKWAGMSSEEQGAWKDRHRGGAKKMEAGGKVEGCGEAGDGMFNWPSRDARNGGKG